PYVDRGHREEALSDALRDVELGAYDELFKDRLVCQLDDPDMRTLVSLFERTREAGILAAVELKAVLQDRNAAGKREEAYGAGRLPGSSADQPTEHYQTAGWADVPGECGAECACGTTVDGFDTVGEATAELNHHIVTAAQASGSKATEECVRRDAF